MASTQRLPHPRTSSGSFRPKRRNGCRSSGSRTSKWNNGGDMSEHVYKHLELTGPSTNGVQDAIQNAVNRAAKTIRGMSWFEVMDTRGHIEDGKVSYWQVTIKVGFTLEE